MKNIFRISIVMSILMVTSLGATINQNGAPKNNMALEDRKQSERPWMPYLTKDKTFIYVDENLKQQIIAQFYKAEPFLPTGFAKVGNKDGEVAIINKKGELVIPFTDKTVNLEVVNGLTLLQIENEYDKNKYEINIMGGPIKTKKLTRSNEVRVLESKQLLLKTDEPANQSHFSFNVTILDDQHFEMNEVLYKIANQKIKKLKSNIGNVLDRGRYIPEGNKTFTINSVPTLKPIISNLIGRNKVEVTINGKKKILDSINLDRYLPTIPKILQESSKTETYFYPMYDKPFPKELFNATPAQVSFIDKTSLIYSVNNSHYFLLGRFNYNHDIWAYDWLYLDQNGKLLDQIEINDFFVNDQLGYLVWPDKKILFPNSTEKEQSNINKIRNAVTKDFLFIVKMKCKEGKIKSGLWNAKKLTWEIPADYYNISVLNENEQVFSLQKEEKGPFQIYYNSSKMFLKNQEFIAVYRDGLVLKRGKDNNNLFYYLDFVTGKEYKDSTIN